WRTGGTQPPPKGATGDGGFRPTPEMMSMLGCPAEELGHVLKALGFFVQRRRLAPVAPDAPPEAAVPPEVAVPPEATVPPQPTVPSQATVPAEATVPPEAVVPLEAAALPEVEAAAPQPPRAEEFPAGTSAEPVTAPEEKWEEVWRPRRKGGEPSGREQRAHKG